MALHTLNFPANIEQAFQNKLNKINAVRQAAGKALWTDVDLLTDILQGTFQAWRHEQSVDEVGTNMYEKYQSKDDATRQQIRTLLG